MGKNIALIFSNNRIKSIFVKGNLYTFSGTRVIHGPDFGYIWCSFDLQVIKYLIFILCNNVN